MTKEDSIDVYSPYDNSLVGQFSWNGQPGFRYEQAPFGGFKMSGNYSKEGVVMCAENYQKIRTFYEH